MIYLNTTINITILYQSFGCSFKVFAGVFTSMTHYYMHTLHSKNKQNTQNDQNTYLLNIVLDTLYIIGIGIAYLCKHYLWFCHSKFDHPS